MVLTSTVMEPFLELAKKFTRACFLNCDLDGTFLEFFFFFLRFHLFV